MTKREAMQTVEALRQAGRRKVYAFRQGKQWFLAHGAAKPADEARSIRFCQGGISA